MGMMLKNEVNDIKLLTPTKSIELLAEATCILFETEPSWENFKFLLSQKDLISSFMNFNKEDVSDNVIKRLKKYIENKHLTLDSLRLESFICGTIYEYVKALYAYAVAKSQVTVIFFLKMHLK
jgi:dynein heavy chain